MKIRNKWLASLIIPTFFATSFLSSCSVNKITLSSLMGKKEELMDLSVQIQEPLSQNNKENPYEYLVHEENAKIDIDSFNPKFPDTNVDIIEWDHSWNKINSLNLANSELTKLFMNNSDYENLYHDFLEDKIPQMHEQNIYRNNRKLNSDNKRYNIPIFSPYEKSWDGLIIKSINDYKQINEKIFTKPIPNLVKENDWNTHSILLSPSIRLKNIVPLFYFDSKIPSINFLYLFIDSAMISADYNNIQTAEFFEPPTKPTKDAVKVKTFYTFVKIPKQIARVTSSFIITNSIKQEWAEMGKIDDYYNKFSDYVEKIKSTKAMNQPLAKYIDNFNEKQ